MKKILAIAILCHVTLLTATYYDSTEVFETQLAQVKNPAMLEHIPTVKRFLTDGAMRYSLQIQIADMRFHPCPVSDRPFFYRITIPATTDSPEHYFYALFSLHTFPVELVMQQRTLKRFIDSCDFVVGEISGERGENLSKEIFAKHGLLMDDDARQQFIDAEKTSIKNALPDFPDSTCETVLSKQVEWLNNWYFQLPAFLRARLESNKDLLVDKDLLRSLHPALIIDKINRELSTDEKVDRQAQQFGMDNAVEKSCKYTGKKYLGLETQRDRMDTGRLEELKEDVQYFMDSSEAPIQMLRNEVGQMPKDASELPSEKGSPQRPYWATYDTSFDSVKKIRESMTRDYFFGKCPNGAPSDSVLKRNSIWKPKINDIILKQLKPWLLMVGLKHAVGDSGLLQWFKTEGFSIERFSNYPNGDSEWSDANLNLNSKFALCSSNSTTFRAAASFALALSFTKRCFSSLFLCSATLISSNIASSLFAPADAAITADVIPKATHYCPE